MKTQLPTVEQCIAYIERTDYKLTNRGRVWLSKSPLYIFKSPTRAPHCQELCFNLTELRDAFRHGF
jgi:hypothetical protein